MSTALSQLASTIDDLGAVFAARAAAHDEQDLFVAQNYSDLRAAKAFSAMVPAEFGGGGLTHAEMCDLIRQLATSCGSTALAFSMHQHLVGVRDDFRNWLIRAA